MLTPPIPPAAQMRPPQAVHDRNRAGVSPEAVRTEPRAARKGPPVMPAGEKQPRRAIKVILAQPRGFCAGVVRAIEIVERALEKYGPPVYVRHEIVHNKFVEELSEVPQGAVTIFSAHGVAKSVVNEAAGRQLPVLDATCPLVTKVHNQGKRYVAQGRVLIL